MSKIHITLVGGQAAPVYHGIVATDPDRVIYIYSNDSRNTLDALHKEVQIPSEDIMLNVTLPVVIKEKVELLAEKYKDDEVTVNISGGLKSWSHWFGVVFDKYENASVVYMDQNNVLWNYKTLKSTDSLEFDMHVLFRLYGNPLENNYTDFADYTEEDSNAISTIENCRAFNNKDFNLLTTILDRGRQNVLKNTKKGSFQINSSSVEWDKDIPEVRLLMNRKTYFREFKVSSPHCIDIAFNSGWFEAKIANLISQWDKAKQVYLNCRFPYRPNIDKNEVDIIVNTGSKILFVECKTQITNNTDIDKFRSVIKGYGGTGSKGIFITDARMSDVAKEKCLQHGILNYSLQDEHMGMPVEKALFLLLDNQLYNINVK